MRLGDEIELPEQIEPAVIEVAALLAQAAEDTEKLLQLLQALRTLQATLTPEVPPLVQGAVQWELASFLQLLPEKHPERNLGLIIACYREAPSIYQESGRTTSIAYLQRGLGQALIEAWCSDEALEPL
jgi:hypothetical protein